MGMYTKDVATSAQTVHINNITEMMVFVVIERHE